MSDVLLIDDPDPGVRRFTLNRPERLNAISRELMDALLRGVRDVADDDTVRALVIRGNGPAFCAGADLDEHFGSEDAMDIGRTDLWDRLESLRVPVISAVHGWAITGGFLLAYSCDLVVASADAKFRDTHAALGVMPTGGESQRMPRRLGVFLARELMLTSRVLSAAKAQEAGFVSQVVERAELDAAALELARTIAANSPRAVSAIKSLINTGTQTDFGTGLRIEALNNDFGAVNNAPDPDRDARIAKVHR